MRKAGDRIASLLAEVSELKQASREVAFANYEAGKAEGRRLERRATRRDVHILLEDERCQGCDYLGGTLLLLIAARSKRGRRKGF